MEQPTLKKIWAEDYRVASYLVNLRGHAGLYSILNFVQDVGWQHAMSAGIKTAKNHGWVFTRQKLMMQRWPKWNETVTIRTWLRPPDGSPFIYRDYELSIAGTKIGECTSTFTVMDMETRKLVVMDWSQFPQIWTNEGLLSGHPEKIPTTTEAETLAQFQVRNSDIDLNNHVNNTKYAQWILDAIPIDVLRDGAKLHGYEVNFLAETKIGDVVLLQKAVAERKAEDDHGSHTGIVFQGVRQKDGKPVFTAELRVV